MPLTLTVLRCPDTVAPETRTIAGGEFAVGRGPGVDWVLPDPERLLSKHHFAVAYRGGAWQVADTSTNGTFINADQEPIGRGRVRTLRDGDRMKLGVYEMEVRLTEEPQQQPAGMGFGGPLRAAASPFADPFAADPLAPPPPPPSPFGEPAYPPRPPSSGAQLPADFDPLAPEAGEEPFRGPTQTDHSPLLDDAFRAPVVSGQMPLHSGGKLPGDDLLPDDWDKDLLDGIAPPGTPETADRPASRAAQPPPPPVQPVPGFPQPAARPSPPPIPAPDQPDAAGRPTAHPTQNPFDEPFDLASPGAAGQPPRPPETAPPPAQATPPSPARPVQPPAQAGLAEAAALAAFLDGAGLTDIQPADPSATMRELGAAFRALVAGVRAVLIARAAVKSEFRIEQTMIRARGNNPLKFSADDDDALAALIGVGRRTDMSAAASVADALKDIRLHELASMAAMQSAVRSVLNGLDPARLRDQAEQNGGLSVLPLQRKARAWDAYEALHARTVQALSDDFDSVFGKAFARAYEQAVQEVSAKEGR